MPECWLLTTDVSFPSSASYYLPFWIRWFLSERKIWKGKENPCPDIHQASRKSMQKILVLWNWYTFASNSGWLFWNLIKQHLWVFFLSFPFHISKLTVLLWEKSYMSQVTSSLANRFLPHLSEKTILHYLQWEVYQNNSSLNQNVAKMLLWPENSAAMGGRALAKAEDWELGESVPKNEVMAELWHPQSWSSRTWVLGMEGLLLSSSLGKRHTTATMLLLELGAFVRDHIDAWLWALLQVGKLFHKHSVVCCNVFVTFINMFSN